MKFFTTVILAFSLLSAGFALPPALRELSSKHLPKGTYTLAFDGNGHVIAYDKNGEKIAVIEILLQKSTMQT
jgi:hypothetical protein